MAKKPTTPPAPTPESRALSAAISAADGVTQASIADALGIASSGITHWTKGTRPLPAKFAQKVADMLGVDPRTISAAYREVSESSHGNVVPIRRGQPVDERESSLAIARLENDVHVLNLAVGALTAAMVSHRPAEARDVAAALRRRVPAKFRDKGFLSELVAMLEKAGKA